MFSYKIFRYLLWGVTLAILLAACGIQEKNEVVTADVPETISLPTEIVEPVSTPAPAALEPTPTRDPDEPPAGAQAEFKLANFSIHSIDYSEIFSGGQSRDGIPPIDTPIFMTIEEADEVLNDVEPVILLVHNGEVRIYPIQIIIWHEIVNDEISGEPISVTFCPLCNTSIVFSGQLDKIKLSFGTTGRLRFSNLVMYDRETETWWQQANGEAIAGSLTGKQLTFIPSSIVAWADVKVRYPDASVLSPITGYSRSYGDNPYPGYDDISSYPFLYYGSDLPTDLVPLARVLGIDLNDVRKAYAFNAVRDNGVVNDVVGGEPIVLFWQPGAVSPFDLAGVEGQDIGSMVAYSSVVEGEILTFIMNGEIIVDENSASQWNIFGEAISGPLAGTVLDSVVATHHFWFSWAAFFPDTTVFTGE